MAIEVHEDVQDGVVSVKISGKLTKADYLQFVPELEKMIQENGKISILFQMHDFHGWDMGAMWEDLKFDIKHASDMERIAMIGEKKWQEWMAKFCIPFTKAKLKYFEQNQIDEAQQWVKEG